MTPGLFCIGIKWVTVQYLRLDVGGAVNINLVKKDTSEKAVFQAHKPFFKSQWCSLTSLTQSLKALYFMALLNIHEYLFLCLTFGTLLRSHCLLCLLNIQWLQTNMLLDWNRGFFVVVVLSCSGWSWLVDEVHTHLRSVSCIISLSLQVTRALGKK